MLALFKEQKFQRISQDTDYHLQASEASEMSDMKSHRWNGRATLLGPVSPYPLSCVKMQEVTALNQAMDAHEGCNLAGWLDVQRVAGNFHISVHAEDFLMLTKVCSAGSPLRPRAPDIHQGLRTSLPSPGLPRVPDSHQGPCIRPPSLGLPNAHHGARTGTSHCPVHILISTMLKLLTTVCSPAPAPPPRRVA